MTAITLCGTSLPVEAWQHHDMQMLYPLLVVFNTLKPRQIGRHFADDTFKRIFLNENVGISIKISLKFVPEGPINNNPALVQIMAWHRPGDKPLCEPMMVSSLTHICVTRPQWVKGSPVDYLHKEPVMPSFDLLRCWLDALAVRDVTVTRSH